jgi:hypothetical protein
MKKKLLPLLPPSWRDEMRFTRSEFENKNNRNGKVKSVTFNELNASYHKDEYSPLDGEMIKASMILLHL